MKIEGCECDKEYINNKFMKVENTSKILDIAKIKLNLN